MAKIMWNEIKRKAFHLLSLAYIPCVVYLPRAKALMFFEALFILVTAFELARLKFSPIRAFIENHFGQLLREEEKTNFSGIFWMLFGILTTLLLLERT